VRACLVRSAIAAVLCLMTTPLAADGPKPRPVGLDDAARLPAPGTTAPGAIAFTPDGKALTFLASEGHTLERALWRMDVAPGASPRVVARAPDGGTTDQSVSPEEALRRERQRSRETGIAQVNRATDADVRVFAARGDLYVQRGDHPAERIATAPGTEVDPQLDPAGRRIAFVRDGDLYVIDLDGGQERRLTEGATEGIIHGLAEFIAQEELDRSTGYWWSPDGQKIAFQETDERHITPYWIAHPAAETPVFESHRYPFAGKPNAKVKLGVVGVEGGEPRWLDLGHEDGEFYLARVAWDGPDALLVQTLTRDQKTLRLRRIIPSSGASSLLIEGTSPNWINLHDDLRVVPGTGELVWSSERTGFRHLELRGPDGALVRVLTEGDWPVDALVAVDAGRREAWFVAGRDDPTGSQLYRVGLDGGPIAQVTTEPGTHRAVVARDGNHYVDTWSAPDRPPLTRLFDRDGKPLATIADAATDPRLAELALAPPRLTHFRNRDGVTLHGAYYPPRGAKPGERRPLVVMVYGGPHVQRVTASWDLTADLTAQLLSERGFGVWKLDNRGSSRRGVAFETAIARDMGHLEVADQAEGVKFAASSFPEIDPGRVGIMGGSYGGYMTLRGLAEAPEVFRAGVASAPVTDWDGYDTAYTERYMGTPSDNSAGYARSSVVKRADRLGAPLLIVHGLMDENVHYRHSARLTAALIAAGKPFELLSLPEERHSSRREEVRRYVLDRTVRFFEAHLNADAPPGR